MEQVVVVVFLPRLSTLFCVDEFGPRRGRSQTAHYPWNKPHLPPPRGLLQPLLDSLPRSHRMEPVDVVVQLQVNNFWNFYD